jgi:hypothetical protein
MMPPRRCGSGALAVLVILSRVGASTAGAQTCAAPACSGPATCSVDAGTMGNDAPGCCAVGMACKTIEFALGQVLAGAVIKVAAGMYPNVAPNTPLTIDKTVTLCGAQAGVDARNPRGSNESIITNPFGTAILPASNVIVDGFTFEGVTFTNPVGFGLDMSRGTEGTQVYNNIFQNNIAGIGLANTGPSQVLICQNLFQNNNQPGSATGSGIYTDQFVCGNVSPAIACTNFLIEQNAFTGNDNAGIDLSNTDPTPMTNVDIATNTFDMNSRAILLFNVDQSTIHNNSITNSTGVASGAIRIFGHVDGLTITNNDMNGGGGWAIRIATVPGPGGGGPSSGIVIHQNNIANFAGSGGMFGGGLFVGPGAYPSGTIDATCNWWNDPCGPFNVTNNPDGIGEEVQEDVPSTVNFSPWLIAPGPAPASGTGTCSGTASTCRATTTTTTTPSSTVPTTTSTPVTTVPTTTSTPVTTTTTVVVPTSTTLPPEICEPLTVTQASFRPSKSTVFIRATFPGGTFAGLDPRQQDVHLQVRDASGELVSCTIPAAQWQKLFQHTFGFFDPSITVCPPIKCLSLALPKKGQTRATMTMAGMTPGSPLLSPLEITFNVDDQCAAGPLSLQQKAGGRRVFP